MIKLRGITWDHPRGAGPLFASVAHVREIFGVNVEWQARSLKDFGDAPLADLARQFDLLVMDHPHVGVAAATGCVHPLDTLLPWATLEALAAASVGPSFASYSYDEHQWALPVDAACQVGACRPDLIDVAALPSAWADLPAWAERLRARNQWIGMALCPTDAACSFFTLCAQQGATWEEAAAPRQTVKIALDALRDLAALCHPLSRTWNPIRLYDHMTSSDEVAYSPLAFGYTNYARAEVARRLQFTGIPDRTHALLGGAGLAVSSLCSRPEVAAQIAAWLCGGDYQSRGYVAAGGQPAHGAAWDDAAADRLTGGFFSGTRATMEASFVRPRHPAWPHFQEYAGECIGALLADPSADIERAIDDLLAAWRRG